MVRSELSEAEFLNFVEEHSQHEAVFSDADVSRFTTLVGKPVPTKDPEKSVGGFRRVRYNDIKETIRMFREKRWGKAGANAGAY